MKRKEAEKRTKRDRESRERDKGDPRRTHFEGNCWEEKRSNGEKERGKRGRKEEHRER